MNVLHIATGLINVIRDELGILPDNIKQMADSRLSICERCEHFGYTCKMCGCILSAKTKSPDTKCPIGKW